MVDVKRHPVMPLSMTFNWVFESSTPIILQRRTVLVGGNKHSFFDGAKAQTTGNSITLILWLLPLVLM